MKPWIVVALVLVALVVLVSPGIVGRLAEENVEAGIVQATRGDVVIDTRSFVRNWFTSEGTHRVELRNPVVRELIAWLAGTADDAAAPVFIVDTHVDHGIVPVTSLTRASGSLRPALANAVSTLELETGDGRRIVIPGEVRTRVGLTGATRLALALERGGVAAPDARIEWQAAEITADYAAGFNAREYTVSLREWRAATPTGSLALAKLDLEGNGAVEGERFEGRVALAIEALALSGGEALDVALDLGLDADAHALQALVSVLAAAQRARGIEAASFDSAVASELQALLARGASLSLERLDVLMPEGPATLRMTVELPPADAARAVSWPSLLLAISATADLRLPAALVDARMAASRETAAAVGLGYLRRDGEDYVMNARFEAGLLTVNGAPLALPLPATR